VCLSTPKFDFFQSASKFSRRRRASFRRRLPNFKTNHCSNPCFDNALHRFAAGCRSAKPAVDHASANPD
jgi:hypothetical protein